MEPIDTQKLIFTSVFECLVVGHERYKELFFNMLEQIDWLESLLSEDEIFNQLKQMSKYKLKIDFFNRYLSKIKNHTNIFSICEMGTDNNILHILLKSNVNISVFRLFLKFTSNDSSILNHQNKYGDTPLHFAVKYNKNSLILEELLKFDINLDLCNKDKNTALHYAVMLLAHNRDFSSSVLEQQISIFNRLLLAYKDKNIQHKNSYGNNILHQLIADIDFCHGITGEKDDFDFDNLLHDIKTKKSNYAGIEEFFRFQYPKAIEIITKKIQSANFKMKDTNSLNYTALQFAFIKKHYPIIKNLYSINDHLTKKELNLNQLSNVILNFAKIASCESIESLKIFILMGGDSLLRNTQLGHNVLKFAIIKQMGADVIDLLVTKAGATILENGDSTEIWKEMFSKIKNNPDSEFKVSTLQTLFHLGINYTKRDAYGRNVEGLAKCFQIQEEFNLARRQFEAYALIQIPRIAKNLKNVEHQQQYFYH